MTAPSIDLFNSNLETYGTKVLNFLKDSNNTFDQKLAATYYDGIRVFKNLYEYTGDAKWLGGMSDAFYIYGTRYVKANNGNIPGYWNFGEGLYNLNTAAASDCLNLLATNGAYARDSTPPAETIPSTMSREVAYVIMTYLNAEKLGFAARPRLQLLIDQCFGHFDQWFVSKTAPYIRPFMVALSSQALIQCVEAKKVAFQIALNTLKLAATEMWNMMWLPANRAFKYTNKTIDPGDENAAPDLNLLICPLYAWLYKETTDPIWRDRADEIFSGGVTQAYLANGKQFNQNYRWSFKYLEWREEGVNPNKQKLLDARKLIDEVIATL